MKDQVFTYKTDDGRISGSFTRKYPEVKDRARYIAELVLSEAVSEQVGEAGDEETQVAILTEVLAEDALLNSMHWGNFRQDQVTWRAEAKRLRLGNKSNAPLSEKETAVRMVTTKNPVYDEPSEAKDEVEVARAAVLSMARDKVIQTLMSMGFSQTEAERVANENEKRKKVAA